VTYPSAWVYANQPAIAHDNSNITVFFITEEICADLYLLIREGDFGRHTEQREPYKYDSQKIVKYHFRQRIQNPRKKQIFVNVLVAFASYLLA
jgi:hypothetical protein